MSEIGEMANRAKFPSSKKEMQAMGFEEFFCLYYAVLKELMNRLPHLPKFFKGLKPVVWRRGDLIEYVTVVRVMIKYAPGKAPKKKSPK